MAYIRKYKTASGATGVQVCWKVRGEVVRTQQVGSARGERAIERLMKEAQKVVDAEKNPMFDLTKFDKKGKNDEK